MLPFIVAAEIAFWVVLAAGLAARYLLGRRTLGAALLVATPLIDLALLAATIADLRGGAEAAFAHGLAAVYIGVSVAFGPSMVRWADERFAHRFAGGPEPWRPPKGGRARTRHEWREFGKAAIAWAVSVALLLGGIALVGDADRTEGLQAWLAQVTLVLAIWSLWPVTHTLWPSRPQPGR
jgi:hypothetical protein